MNGPMITPSLPESSNVAGMVACIAGSIQSGATCLNVRTMKMQQAVDPAAPRSTYQQGGFVMNIVLWVLQVLLAAAFLAHGWLFLTHLRRRSPNR